MSSLLDIESELQFGDADGLRWWFQTHANQHRLYAANLATRYGVQAPAVDLLDQAALLAWIQAMQQGEQAPATSPELATWLLLHNNLHQAELAALSDNTNLSLTTNDFRQQDQFYGWLYDHIQLHDVEDQYLT